jgi:hypothetical protein
VTPVDGAFEDKAKIKLPGKAGMALRLRRIQ